MKHDKSYLRNKFLIERRRKFLKSKKFNFSLIFKLIKKHFKNKKIIIGGYYPSYYEVNILKFFEEASKKKLKIVLPIVKSSISMSFRIWDPNEPLYVNKFGILEPKSTNKEFTPDFIIVPLVAFDGKLNRIGYGKGFYDRKLKEIKKIKSKMVCIGAAYSFQKCKSIPINQHDYKLDYVFTERGIISSRK